MVILFEGWIIDMVIIHMIQTITKDVILLLFLNIFRLRKIKNNNINEKKVI